MWRENLYRPIEILVREHTVFPVDEHRHSFFEMACIVSGCGTFRIWDTANGSRETEYAAGDLFLIPPETVHRFVVGERSRFVFVRFTESYAADYIGDYVGRTLAMNDSYPVPLDTHEEGIAASLVGMIADEACGNRRFGSHLQQYWANSLIVLAARNMNRSVRGADVTDDRPMFLMQYMQQHIHQPELLRAEALGRVFNMSPSYMGRYFKRNFQETLQDFVVRNRIGMVENMLANSRMTIKEIAYRMGYADASHLEKAFVKYHGITPLRYRREHFTEG